MGVGIDEARQKDATREFKDALSPLVSAQSVGPADLHYPSAPDDDRTMRNRRSADGKHPIGLEKHHTAPCLRYFSRLLNALAAESHSHEGTTPMTTVAMAATANAIAVAPPMGSLTAYSSSGSLKNM